MSDQPSSQTEEGFRRLIDVGTALLSELDVEVVLQSVVQAAREVTSAQYAALGVLDRERAELERFIHLGIDEETRRGIGSLPRGRGVLGELIREPKPLRLADVNRHPHAYGFPPGHPPMNTFLGVPITIRGEAYGNLYMTEKQGGREFDSADEAAAITLATWAGIAIENARLYTALSARELEVERALRHAETSVDIARVVGGETDVGRVLELIVKRARALVEARTPMYELALLAEKDLAKHGVEGASLVVVTPEDLPLQLFGAAVSSRVAGLLDERGIEVVAGAVPVHFGEGRLTLSPRATVEADAVLSLPRMEARRIGGLPHDLAGFVPVDRYGRVPGMERVYAVGDVTTFPIKQGGIAAQQADAAAASIAAELVSGIVPEPLEPIVRGVLWTGSRPLYLSGRLGEGNGETSSATEEPPWDGGEGDKLVARYLTPFFAELAAARN